MGNETHVTIERACNISGFTPQHIERLCNRGILVCTEENGARMIEVSTLEKYSEKRGQSRKNPEDKKEDVTEEAIVLSGVKYVSTDRASRLTGLSESEINELVHNNAVVKKTFGERTFIGLESLFAHRRNELVEKTHPHLEPERNDIPPRIVRPQKISKPYVAAKYEPIAEKNFLPNIPVKEKIVINREQTIPREERYGAKERPEYVQRRDRTPHRTITKDTIYMHQPETPEASGSVFRTVIYVLLGTLLLVGAILGYLAWAYTPDTVEHTNIFGPLLRATTSTVQYYSR